MYKWTWWSRIVVECFFLINVVDVQRSYPFPTPPWWAIMWQPLTIYVYSGARLFNIHVHTYTCIYRADFSAHPIRLNMFLSHFSDECQSKMKRGREERRGEDSGKTGSMSYLSLTAFIMIFVQIRLSGLSQHPPCDETDSAFLMEAVRHCAAS